MTEVTGLIENLPTETHFRYKGQPVTVLTGKGAEFNIGEAVEKNSFTRLYLEGANAEAGSFVSVIFPDGSSSTLLESPKGIVRLVHDRNLSRQHLLEHPIIILGEEGGVSGFGRITVFGHLHSGINSAPLPVAENPKLRFNRLAQKVTRTYGAETPVAA